MIRFFTYGTFRQGECRHDVLQRFKPEFVQVITTAPEYKLFNLGSFPGMIEGNEAVVGELYNLPEIALHTLDMIESHPSFFCRKEIKLEDGTLAVAYLFQHATSNLCEITSNDWRNK
jgi:gamma-glutamylcyclotransferase (GGCT)/AIG2-like uncharacterized protein YtfP